jgi:hypothetical protein
VVASSAKVDMASASRRKAGAVMGAHCLRAR